jgi:hypothetical protein
MLGSHRSEEAAMASDVTSGIDLSVRDQPPVEGATLVGWVALVEWVTRDGERVFERFGEPSRNTTQLKGYLHGGLYRMATIGFDERRTA